MFFKYDYLLLNLSTTKHQPWYFYTNSKGPQPRDSTLLISSQLSKSYLARIANSQWLRVVFSLTFAVNVPSQGLNCQRFRVLWSLICHGPFYVIYTIILSFIKLTSRTRHISNFFLSRVFVGSLFFNTFSRQKHR